MNFEARDSRFKQVIAQDAVLEAVVTDLLFTEGPIWHPYEKHLTFSDITGNTMYRWSEKDGLTVFRQPSQYANGNTYDQHGNIYTCEHGTSRVSQTDPDGNYKVVATHYDGKELNSPNDIVVKSDGAVYFTDPNYGRLMKEVGIVREQELSFQGVFRLDPESGALTLLADDFEKPNGLCFSPDEELLYVNETARGHIRVFDVLADGTVTNGRLWAELSGAGEGWADGMKMNRAGHLFCTGPGGIHVFDDAANCLGVILLGDIQATNFTWGGDDLQSLFITTSQGTLHRVRVKAPGVKLF